MMHTMNDNEREGLFESLNQGKFNMTQSKVENWLENRNKSVVMVMPNSVDMFKPIMVRVEATDENKNISSGQQSAFGGW